MCSPSPKKFICRQVYGLCFPGQRVVLVNFMSRGHNVNADLLYVICKSDEVCCRKVSFFNMTMIFTTQHTCQTVQKIEEMGWELLLHLQYSPVIFICLDQSRNHLEALFENNEAVQQHVRKFLYDANKDFYATGFSSLAEQWEYCIELNGNHDEK